MNVGLRDLTENRTVVTNSIAAITSIVLKDDLHYEYSIVLVNEIGESSESDPVDICKFTACYAVFFTFFPLYAKYIVTSDVRSASICQAGSTMYIIQCAYVTGSNGRGCVYCITEPSQENVTGTIARTNLNGVVVELANGYNEVVVYDWENDNTTGILPIRKIDTTITCQATEITGMLQ